MITFNMQQHHLTCSSGLGLNINDLMEFMILDPSAGFFFAAWSTELVTY